MEAAGANAVKTCWANHASDLTSSLLSKIVSANQLIDVDWSFGVTAASDDSDKVMIFCSYIIQFSLYVAYCEGGKDFLTNEIDG